MMIYSQNFNKLYRLIMMMALLFSSFILRAEGTSEGLTKILIISGAHGVQAKTRLLNQLAETKGLHFEHKSIRGLEGDNLSLFNQYSMVIFSAINAEETEKKFIGLIADINQSDSRFLAISWPDGKKLRKGGDVTQAKILQSYFSNGGVSNLSYMLDYLNQQWFNPTGQSVPVPRVYAQQGLYHPEYAEKIFITLSDYLDWQASRQRLLKDKPVIGIAMYRSLFEGNDTQVVDELIAKLEAAGALPVPFYYQGQQHNQAQLLSLNKQLVVHNIINLRSIHLAQQRKAEFIQMGVPIIQALTYYTGDQAQWEADKQGISASMTPFTLVLPEAAGVIDPIIIAASVPKTKERKGIAYQMDALVERSLKLAQLRLKNNADKKIALMVWNYPSGEKNVGASFLNVPRSLSEISKHLKAEGYKIDSHPEDYYISRVARILRPFYRDYELDDLLKDDLAELVPLSFYTDWYNTLPESVRKTVEARWGQPEDNFMVVQREGQQWFVMPRIKTGNMIIMRQPPRSDKADDEKANYHNKITPINHYYLAAYQYARSYFSSDAFIHLGTHGSHEYLPGKERGLSVYDAGNLSVANTPVIYPFIVDDVGEAMQTKRRGRATVISHMTPPLVAAGLNADSAKLHELMHQHKSMDQGGVKQRTASEITQICFAQNYCKDIGWSRSSIEADFPSFMAALHYYLVDLAAQNQPLGLHTFGRLADETHLIATLIQMLGTGFRSRAAEFEAEHYGMEEYHHDATEFSKEHLAVEQGGELSTLTGYKLLEDYVVNKQPLERVEDGELRADLLRAQQYYQNMQGILEIPNLIAALAGRYIPVANGGDPVRSPDSLPTGNNLYGFDPSKVPTQAAWHTGKDAVAGLIADYYQQHGHYPDKMAFSLWSIETMRHYGVLESQVLYAMGVRPIWDEDGRIKDTEIIPFSELKRPRVDVVLSATGLYRDAFPNVMQWIAKAISQVAQLKEKNNPLYQNSQALKAELIEAGIEADEAEYLSTVRIFSNESGNYGTGLGGAVMKSDSWERDVKLADLYLDRMGYYYGADDSRWGQKPAQIDLFAKILSGTDVALFSRSSNVYGVLTSDDPFQYLGGLSLAVRRLDGVSPELYISNLRDPKHVRTESIAKFLAKELRTRSFHPRWIKEMQKEGYAGALNMLDNLNNFWGWQVVDPSSVREDQWQEFFAVYVQDKYQLDIKQWFAEANNHSQAQMIERMLEAIRKDYWAADEKVIRELVDTYVELAKQYDITTDNEKLTEFVNQQAQGFGLSPLPTEIAPLMSGQKANAAQTVQGQKLIEVKAEQQTDNEMDDLYWVAILILLLFIAGVVRQAGIKPVRSQLEKRAMNAY